MIIDPLSERKLFRVFSILKDQTGLDTFDAKDHHKNKDVEKVLKSRTFVPKKPGLGFVPKCKCGVPCA